MFDSTGYTAPRAADFLTLLRTRVEAETGLTFDWSPGTVAGDITSALAIQLGTLGELSQELYDALSVQNATGRQLDNLCLLVGVTRQEATHSTATVTLTGTAGTVLPPETLMEGGGLDGRARWRLASAATIGGGGTVSATVEAVEAGVVEALAGEIATIVTPVAGWTAVTNPAAATAGVARETDAELRQRRAVSLQVQGSRSLAALRGRLLAIEGVEAAACLDNATDATATVQGVSIPAHGIGVVILPDPMTAAAKTAVATLLYGEVAAGIAYGGDEVVTVTGEDGYEKTIRFYYGSDVSVDVGITVTLASGYDYSEVEDAIAEGVDAIFAGLTLGSALRILEIQGMLADIEGIEGAVVTLDAGSADIEATLSERLVLGTLTSGEA